MALLSDNLGSTFSRLNGEVLADKTVEAASLAVGSVGGKVLSGLGRFGSIASNGVRGSYKAHFANWKNDTNVMQSGGVSIEHIAKRVSNVRLAARSRYQLQTPFLQGCQFMEEI